VTLLIQRKPFAAPRTASGGWALPKSTNGAVHHTKAVLFAGRISQHRVDRSCLLIRGRMLHGVEFVLGARGGNHHVGTGTRQTKSHRASKPRPATVMIAVLPRNKPPHIFSVIFS
jgi:hypothetical protein